MPARESGDQIGQLDPGPKANDDSYSTVAGATLTVDAPGVLANDSDTDADPLLAKLVSGPSHGTLTLYVDGSFDYTPNAGYAGADSFTYKAFDGTQDTLALYVLAHSLIRELLRSTIANRNLAVFKDDAVGGARGSLKNQRRRLWPLQIDSADRFSQVEGNCDQAKTLLEHS